MVLTCLNTQHTILLMITVTAIKPQCTIVDMHMMHLCMMLGTEDRCMMNSPSIGREILEWRKITNKRARRKETIEEYVDKFL